MNCQEKVLHIHQLAEDRLPGGARDDLMRHLESCIVCQERLEDCLRQPEIGAAVSSIRASAVSLKSVSLKSGNSLSGIGHKGWRILAAAVVVVVLSTLWFGKDGPLDPNAAYAEMLRKLEEIQSVTFRQENNFGIRCLHFQTRDGKWRRETSNGERLLETLIYDGKSLTCQIPETKTVYIYHNPYHPDFKPDPYWVEIRGKIDEGKSLRKAYLGEWEIEDRTVLCYEVELADQGAFTRRSERIWIDASSRLPFRVESRYVFDRSNASAKSMEEEKERLAGFVKQGQMSAEEAQKRIQASTKSHDVLDIRHDFQWNEKLDDSLFNVKVPEGWTKDEFTYTQPEEK